jgi:hypothetical protein
MNWKGCGWKWLWPNLRYYPGICLEGWRKTMRILSQNSQSPGWDLNLGPPKYEARGLTTITTFSDLTNSVAQEPEGSSPHSQQPATGPCPEPVESNPPPPPQANLPKIHSVIYCQISEMSLLQNQGIFNMTFNNHASWLTHGSAGHVLQQNTTELLNPRL